MPPAHALFGFLNLNKPSGCSSRDLVNRVQKFVRPLKTGHAGTLDPMATGVLLVCIGDATRLVSRIQEFPKTYLAEFTLGQSSDTDDSSGSIRQHPTPAMLPSADAVQTALKQLTGVITQTPPAYSAVHVAGRRAYELARQGETPRLQPREVTIHHMRLLEYLWPTIRVEIECSSGTYVRSVARDLGVILGCGGLMSQLERTAIGAFHVKDSLDSQVLSPTTIHSALISPLEIVAGLSWYGCTETDLDALRCGKQLPIQAEQLRQTRGALVTGASVALVADEPPRLCAIAEISDNQLLQPRLVFLH